jgi:surfactin synthase thioesterase subunit
MQNSDMGFHCPCFSCHRHVQRYMANSTASINPAKVTLPGDVSLFSLPLLTMLGLMVVRAVAVMVAVPVVPAPWVTLATLVGGLLAVVAGEATTV